MTRSIEGEPARNARGADAEELDRRSPFSSSDRSNRDIEVDKISTDMTSVSVSVTRPTTAFLDSDWAGRAV